MNFGSFQGQMPTVLAILEGDGKGKKVPWEGEGEGGHVSRRR